MYELCMLINRIGALSSVIRSQVESLTGYRVSLTLAVSDCAAPDEVVVSRMPDVPSEG
jgi:hypothetical protein